MKHLLACCAVLALSVFLRAEATIEVAVTNVPKGATEIVFLVDTMAPAETPGYDDPNQTPPAAAPAVVIPPAAGQPAQPDPAATPPPAQRRRRTGNAAAKAMVPIRGTMKPGRADPLVWQTNTTAGENLRVRVVALKGDGTFPLVVAGGKATSLKVEDGKIARVTVRLSPPALELSAQNPSAVTAGAKFTLAGTVTDPASFLGTKNRMRVWWSAGQPPAENRAGRQVSTVDVSTKGDVVSFSIELIAPREPGPLYVQFGEVSNDFNPADGTQVPFLVFPDVTAGVAPVKVLVGPLAARQ